MGKLIYADDIIKRLERVIRFGGKDPDGEHPISAECVLSALKSLPTVDAVPVVRCKDCRWRTDKSGSTAWRPCRALVTPDNFSCVIGERKGGDGNG